MGISTHFPVIFFTLLTVSSFSQTKGGATQTVSGKIVDEKNKPVGFASIIIEDSKNGAGVLADSLGNFTLPIKTNTKLLISKVGFDKTTLYVTTTDTLLNIVLKTQVKTLQDVSVSGNTTSASAVARNNDINRQTAGNTINSFRTTQNLSSGPSVIEGVKIGSDGPPELVHSLNYAPTGQRYTGALLPVFSEKEETKGSRYMFKNWVKGSVVDAGGNFINNDSFSYNYDKMKSRLLFTRDEQNVIEIDYEAIKSFSLTDDINTYSFIKDPSNEKEIFILQLNSVTGKYSLCKKIKTHFEKSDYKSTGMIETGNKYDEFVDEKEYLVFNNKDKQFQKISLKKSSINDVLFKDGPLVKKYFSDHKDDEIDEVFLKGLIDFINKSTQQ